MVSLNKSFAEDSLALSLQRVYQSYTTISSKKDISHLVSLDQELRHLMDRSWEDLKQAVDSGVYREEYLAIGISVGHYSGALQYSGKLLKEAHNLNPMSAFRSYTLYSTVNCDAEDCRIPDIDSGKTYVKEFPNGPYIYEVYVILSYFYADLSNKISWLTEGGGTFTHDCYDRFITSEPLIKQLTCAQEAELFYHQLAVDEFSAKHGLKKIRVSMKQGKSNVWHYCGD